MMLLRYVSQLKTPQATERQPNPLLRLVHATRHLRSLPSFKMLREAYLTLLTPRYTNPSAFAKSHPNFQIHPASAPPRNNNTNTTELPNCSLSRFLSAPQYRAKAKSYATQETDMMSFAHQPAGATSKSRQKRTFRFFQHEIANGGGPLSH